MPDLGRRPSTGYKYCFETDQSYLGIVAAGDIQVSSELLPFYESLGFRRIKIGDDAVVDLARSASREGGALGHQTRAVPFSRRQFAPVQSQVCRRVVAALRRLSKPFGSSEAGVGPAARQRTAGAKMAGRPARHGVTRARVSLLLTASLWADVGIPQAQAAAFSLIVFTVLTLPLLALGLCACLSAGLTWRRVRQLAI